jgi:UDP-N-acetylglucosamine:LPS N-acetylglucosamine transferase
MSPVDREGPECRRKKILAVSSSGGHWTELLRLRSAFAGNDVVYVTTRKDCKSEVPGDRLRIVVDANQWTKVKLVIMLVQVFFWVAWERPDFVISTGAAPGYFAIRFGKLFGARTVWLESIANAEELSLSAKLVQPYADLLLTQWPHLAAPNGPSYSGDIL